MKKFKTALSFDDVLLIPQRSDIESRSEVDTSSVIGEHKFRLPIISSPMDTVTGEDMAFAMGEAGGFGIVHRYNTVKDQSSLIRRAATGRDYKVGAAIGVSGDFESRASSAIAAGAFLLCIDVAHGHHSNVERAIKTLKDKFGEKVSIMAGNVATAEAFADLQEWGSDV